MKDEDRQVFWNCAPYLKCGRCGDQIPLPYGTLHPLGDEEEWNGPEDNSLLEMPLDGWSVIYGCKECGIVQSYDTSDVYSQLVARDTKGAYPDDATAFYVEFLCANKNCKIPTKVLVDMKGELEADFLRLLESGRLLGDLPCGHSFVLRKGAYMTSRVSARLW
jgi:hypothetical protein